MRVLNRSAGSHNSLGISIEPSTFVPKAGFQGRPISLSGRHSSGHPLQHFCAISLIDIGKEISINAIDFQLLLDATVNL